jgi:flagellar FliL protein
VHAGPSIDDLNLFGTSFAFHQFGIGSFSIWRRGTSMAETSVEEIPPPKSRFGWKNIVIGVAVILIVASGSTYAVFKYFRGTAKAAAAEKVKKETVQGALNLEPFLVNLADKDAVRFVKVSFRLGISEKGAEEEIGKDKVFLAAARDSILTLLTAKTSEEILTLEGKEHLRQEVQSRLNPLMPKGKILEVYIVDFVVQL